MIPSPGIAVDAVDAPLAQPRQEVVGNELGHGGLLPSVAVEGDRGHECVLRLPGVQTRVLHDDRDVRLDQARVVGRERHRLGVLEVVEPQVERPPGRHRRAVRPGGLPVLEEERDLDVRVLVGDVEQARGLVAQHRRLGAVAVIRDPALGDRPALAAERFHQALVLLISDFDLSRRPSAETSQFVNEQRVASVTDD